LVDSVCVEVKAFEMRGDASSRSHLPLASRVHLFGALSDVGGLLEQEPAAPDV